MIRSTLIGVVALVALTRLDTTQAHACTSVDTYVGGLVATHDGKRMAYWKMTSNGGADGGTDSVYVTDRDGRTIALFESYSGPGVDDEPDDDDEMNRKFRAAHPPWLVKKGPQNLRRLIAGVARGDRDELFRRITAHFDMKPLGPAFDAPTPLVGTGECGAWLVRLRDIQTKAPSNADDEEDSGHDLYEPKIRALAAFPLTQAQVDACDFAGLVVSVEQEPTGGCGYQEFGSYNTWSGAKLRGALNARKASKKQWLDLSDALATPAGDPRIKALRTYLKSHPKDVNAWHALFVDLRATNMPWPKARAIVTRMPRVLEDGRYGTSPAAQALEIVYEHEDRYIEKSAFSPGDWSELPDYQRWRRTRTVLAKANAVPWLVSEDVDCFKNRDGSGCSRDDDTGIYYDLWE